ncbi:hypothetical protein IAD21_04619 [Abditibacteriota bacterium]|nr:hypothetical protein IAD21_04619 [Abditibacteriota bacterium]
MEPLGEAFIRDQAGGKIFARGEDYWRQGLVLSVVKRGQSLHGKVEGSDYKPYQVVIQWQSDGGVEATCSCPYGDEWDGWCKHIVAVLLEYENEPVEDQQPLSEVLKSLSKQELLDLLVAVSERKPEFYDAVVAVFNGEEIEEDDDEGYDY